MAVNNGVPDLLFRIEFDELRLSFQAPPSRTIILVRGGFIGLSADQMAHNCSTVVKFKSRSQLFTICVLLIDMLIVTDKGVQNAGAESL